MEMDGETQTVSLGSILVNILNNLPSSHDLVKLELWESVIVYNNIFWSATNLWLRYASAKCGR